MAQNGPRMTQNDPKWPKNDPKLPQMAQKLRPDLRTFSAILFDGKRMYGDRRIGLGDPFIRTARAIKEKIW